MDIPVGQSFKTKFTMSSEQRDGYMHSVGIDNEYGDINDDVFRADFLWDRTERFSARFNVESTESDRDGPARGVFEITLPEYFPASNYNTNANVQAYLNVGIDWTEANYATGPRGQRLGEYDTAITMTSAGLLVDQERASLDLNWDISDSLQFRSITGTREIVREAFTEFDGTEDDSQTRIWTWNLPEMTCDIWSGVNAPRRATLSQGQLEACATLRAEALAGGRGVTPATFTLAANQNGDILPWNKIEGDAFFADLTWRITDDLTASFGYRTADQENTTSLGVPVVLAPVFPDVDPAGDVYAYSRDVFPPRS